MEVTEILIIVIFTVLTAVLFACLAYKYAQCKAAIRHYEKRVGRINNRLLDVVSGEETIHIVKSHCDGGCCKK